VKQTQVVRRSERLDARVTPEEKRTIETAARLRGTSVTDFLVMNAKLAATQAIREKEMQVLSERSRQVFAQALLTKSNRRTLASAKRLKRETRLPGTDGTAS
jgi:uncharacterized protein (DUF1778 family)